MQFQNSRAHFPGCGFFEVIQMMRTSSYPQLFETIQSYSLTDRIIARYQTTKFSGFWRFVLWTSFLRPPTPLDLLCQRTPNFCVLIYSERGTNPTRGHKSTFFH